MKENKLMSVNQIYHLEIAKIMQKYSLNDIPSPFMDMFRGRERQSTMRSRSDSTFVQAPSRTQKYMQSTLCWSLRI